MLASQKNETNCWPADHKGFFTGPALWDIKKGMIRCRCRYTHVALVAVAHMGGVLSPLIGSAGSQGFNFLPGFSSSLLIWAAFTALHRNSCLCLWILLKAWQSFRCISCRQSGYEIWCDPPVSSHMIMSLSSRLLTCFTWLTTIQAVSFRTTRSILPVSFQTSQTHIMLSYDTCLLQLQERWCIWVYLQSYSCNMLDL